MLHRSKKDTLLIGMTGDVMIGRMVNDYLSRHTSASLWGNLLPILKSTDLNLINLEAALTTSSHPAPKTFNFKADPIVVQSLLDANVTVANLANNHILDYSTAGLEETIKTLDKAGILHTGAGMNLSLARQPAICETPLLKIAIIGCTDNEPLWKADADLPGTHYIEVGDITTLKQDIESVADADLIILSIHWGPNMCERPPKEFVDFAHKAVDLGVDIVHGHSAHIFQGIEVYKGSLILYDTGDFIDDYYVDPLLRNDRSFFFVVEVGKKGVYGVYLLPILIDNFQVHLAKENDFLETTLRMQALSREFHCDLILQENGLFPYPHLSCVLKQ